jgi:hypothetical protein
MNQENKALQRAYEMGAKGAEPTEAERLLFEAWMRGHCWAITGDWDGTTYVHEAERNLRQVHPGAMNTRQLWAAWRDRAAIAAQPAPVQEPEIVQRVKRYAGQTMRTARNPNITARECIELANWIVATPPAAQLAPVPLTPEQRKNLWVSATIELPSQENCYYRGIADSEAYHGITAAPEKGQP